MAENPNQPREYDAVLGSQAPVPISGVVLGGLEGVKRRLASGVVGQQFAALSESLKYGQEGLDLVIRALEVESGQVQWHAYSLLRERSEPRVKEVLQEYTPVELISLLGVDYRNLRDLLAERKWREADQETASIMLKVSGSQKSWLTFDDIRTFPCQDLFIIDRLWLKYSNGRFGFSMQKSISQIVSQVDYQNLCFLGDRVGWRIQGSWLDYEELQFRTTAPVGHLPVKSIGNIGNFVFPGIAWNLFRLPEKASLHLVSNGQVSGIWEQKSELLRKIITRYQCLFSRIDACGIKHST